ncbi:MAG: translation elongation factor Ts [Chloroflexi bacterium]|nr:translation elongation factor Ts [Chloroflexota bacterium]
MQITTDAVKALREETGAGIMDCKRALTEAQGDIAKAKVVLRERGFAAAAKKAERETEQGVVEAYIHGGGRIGALVEVNCETDFVARNEAFRSLAREIAMQVAAMNPRFVSKDEATLEVIRAEQLSDADIAQQSLLSQPYIRDQSRTIQDLITETIHKTGENVRVRRFARFELGK